MTFVQSSVTPWVTEKCGSTPAWGLATCAFSGGSQYTKNLTSFQKLEQHLSWCLSGNLSNRRKRVGENCRRREIWKIRRKLPVLWRFLCEPKKHSHVRGNQHWNEVSLLQMRVGTAWVPASKVSGGASFVGTLAWTVSNPPLQGEDRRASGEAPYSSLHASCTPAQNPC